MKKMTATKAVKILRDKESWGDLGETVRVTKGMIEVVDTFYYGAWECMENLKNTWTVGYMGEFFRKEYGVEFKVEESTFMDRAKGRYKKLTGGDLGVAIIILSIVE